MLLTEQIARFFYGWYQMITLYLRVLLNVMKMLRFCLNFSYRSVRALFFGGTDHLKDDDESLTSKKGKHHHRKTQANGIDGKSSAANKSKSN